MFSKFNVSNSIFTDRKIIYKGLAVDGGTKAVLVGVNNNMNLMPTSGMWVNPDEDLTFFNVASGNLVANQDLLVEVLVTGTWYLSASDTVHLIAYDPANPTTTRQLLESFSALTTSKTIQRRVMTGLLPQGYTLGFSITSAVNKTLTVEDFTTAQNIIASMEVSINAKQSYA